MNYLFDCLLKTTIISSISICILLLLKKSLFKIFSKKFNYYIWLIIISRMLFFFFSYSIDFTKETSKNYVLIDNITKLDNKINPSADISSLILLTWIIVAIVTLSYTLIKYIRFKNLIVDTSYEVEDEYINNMYQNLLIELNIKKNIPLRYTDELESPAGIGLFKSYVLLLDLPYDKDKIYWILKHELIHFKNKDILIRFLVEIIKSLYWFNPLVYVMSKKIVADCELCCDESVMNNCSIKERKLYGLTLLHSIELVKFNDTELLTTEFNKLDLEIRLENILKSKGKNGIILAILIFIISSTSFLEINALEPIRNKMNSENKATTENEGFKFDETIDYTYATAPEKYRKKYKETCKKLGITPRDSDIIEVSTQNEDNLIPTD
ncbi:M56 family metallopeptidase [Clostridioides difficile]|uniref:M56 family metallopeptidase n=1 Tax=Clostridioides difficile TaxID=1496 RepID=UPI000D1E8764|nr:M56 family metallopeptidase [Clostridioides difficile]HBE9444576.1 M56 family metallopeptidase [Clostridioides difficile]